jgi:hypothetical protein
MALAFHKSSLKFLTATKILCLVKMARNPKTGDFN